MRWLVLLALVGCQAKVYDGLPPGQRPPSDRAGYQEGREEAVEAAKIAAEVACDRLWGDCASLCNSDFVYCGNDEEQCVRDYSLGAVEDLTFPVYSRELAEACADQLGERSCLDLDPNSAECEAAVLEGCPDDEDGYGRPYSWLAASELTALPTTIHPHLCDDVEEWFVFHLDAGEALTVTLVSGTAPAWLELDAPVGVAGGRQDVENVGFSIYLDPSSTHQDTQMFMAAPADGFYYLKLDLNQANVGDLEIAVGTDERAPPTAEEIALATEEIVYGALCERLHGDCSSACSAPDFYCGASVDECITNFARSAVDQLFDGDARPLDRTLAESCAADLAQKSCAELGNASCGELLVRTCDGDPQSFARPIAGRMAEAAPLPATLDLDLCDGIRQFFRIDLDAGDHLVMSTDVAPIDSLYGQLYPPTATEEDLRDSDNYLFWSFYLTTEPTITDPVPMSGTYYFQIDYRADGPLRLLLGKQ